MAIVQPLKEDQNRSVLLVTGTGAEAGSLVIDASQLEGAKAGLSFHDYQVESINWSFPYNNPGYLSWQGATGFFVMNGTGQIRFKRDFSSTGYSYVQNPYYANGATGVAATYYGATGAWSGATGFAIGTGDMILNYAGSVGYSFVIGVLKNPSAYTRYHSVEPVLSLP
jgi:hypothetical protein